MARDIIDLVVLDTIADDVESVENILNRLNHPEFGWRKVRGGTDFARNDVVTTLLRLIKDGLVEACRSEADGLVQLGPGIAPTGDLNEYWFGITPHGLMIHAAWEPGELAT